MRASAIGRRSVADPGLRDAARRLSQLLDPGSGTPLREPGNTGVHTVRGLVDGAKVVAFCTDATLMGGAMGAAGCDDIVAAIDTAVRERCPVIGIWHCGGARLGEGVRSLEGVGRVFTAIVRASGRVPQLSVVVGPAAGGAAYGPALTDLVIMAPDARMFVTGPDVVRDVTGEEVDMADLGGPEPHGRRSGVVHVRAASEPDAYARARRITTLFTRPGMFDPHLVRDEDDLRPLLPARPNQAYDVKPLLRRILDDGAGGLEELQAAWAPNIVVGLGRLGGRAVGVVANNPLRKGGCLDSLAAEKAARFVRMCDSQGVPLLVVVDVPGFLPGVRQEWEGVIRRGAKLLHAFAEAVVPRVTLVTRKSYGGAYIAMNSRALGATAVFAWPEAEAAVMGAEPAVRILYRRELAAAPAEEREALRAALVAEHERTCGGLHVAVAQGAIDEVIDPAQTRRKLAEALAAAPAGRGAHGNIPL
ncbi:acyl-CoA carboxylase subunit beta [Streptosporangium fragile]|uniref:Acyl-CoA carboxylase subunit beta n=1 Tax=Streptosporangium fragile TaxID=46186 RepID=A0ABN3W8J1_9ACTN